MNADAKRKQVERKSFQRALTEKVRDLARLNPEMTVTDVLDALGAVQRSLARRLVVDASRTGGAHDGV